MYSSWNRFSHDYRCRVSDRIPVVPEHKVPCSRAITRVFTGVLGSHTLRTNDLSTHPVATFPSSEIFTGTPCSHDHPNTGLLRVPVSSTLLVTGFPGPKVSDISVTTSFVMHQGIVCPSDIPGHLGVTLPTDHQPYNDLYGYVPFLSPFPKI